MRGPSHLQVGIDVPWVTSWSEERQTGVSPCPSVDGVLAVGQQERPGEGRPLYSQNHLFRQRRTVREMRCPMCGQTTSSEDRWSQTAKFTSVRVLRERGFGPDLPEGLADDRQLLNCGAIAPLHFACAEASLQRCPHLGRMSDKSLKRFPAEWVVIPLWIKARVPDGQIATIAAAVSFLQLVGIQPG